MDNHNEKKELDDVDWRSNHESLENKQHQHEEQQDTSTMTSLRRPPSGTREEADDRVTTEMEDYDDDRKKESIQEDETTEHPLDDGNNDNPKVDPTISNEQNRDIVEGLQIMTEEEKNEYDKTRQNVESEENGAVATINAVPLSRRPVKRARTGYFIFADEKRNDIQKQVSCRLHSTLM
jgi:hypothetical protein